MCPALTLAALAAMLVALAFSQLGFWTRRVPVLSPALLWLAWACTLIGRGLLALRAPSRPARVTSNERITSCTRGQGPAAGEGSHA